MVGFSLNDTCTLGAEHSVEGWQWCEVFSAYLSDMKPLPHKSGKGLLGPPCSQCAMPKLQLPFHKWGAGRRSEPLPLEHSCPGLSFSNRQLGAGWEMQKSYSSCEECPIVGSWGRESPVFLDAVVWSEVPTLLNWEREEREKSWSFICCLSLGPFPEALNVLPCFCFRFVLFYNFTSYFTSFNREQVSRATHIVMPEVNSSELCL